MRVNVKGVIIPQDYKRVYDWFDMESTTPKDVADALASANGQPIEVYIKCLRFWMPCGKPPPSGHK